MRRPLARFAAAASGATAVEFGILAVPFLMIVCGTMEFGRVMWTREALEQTAITGARCMGLSQSSCGMGGVYSAGMTQNYVIAQATQWGVTLTSDNIMLDNSATCGGVAGFSQVKLAYTFKTVLPQLINALANADLKAVACFPTHR